MILTRKDKLFDASILTVQWITALLFLSLLDTIAVRAQSVGGGHASLSEAAAAVEDRLLRHHLVHDQVMSRTFIGTDTSTAVGPGDVEHATWISAALLAGMAYKQAVRRAPEDLETIKRLLRGIRRAQSISGVPGRMARGCLPVSAANFRAIQNLACIRISEDPNYPAFFWIPGAGRLEYLMTSFACVAAHDYVPDNVVKDEARQVMLDMLHYLRGASWSVKDSTVRCNEGEYLVEEDILAILKAASYVLDSPSLASKYKARLEQDNFPGVLTHEILWPSLYYDYRRFGMSILSLNLLCRLERNEEVRELYRRILTSQHWRSVSEHGNPLLSFLSFEALGSNEPDILDTARVWLSRLAEFRLRPGHSVTESVLDAIPRDRFAKFIGGVLHKSRLSKWVAFEADQGRNPLPLETRVCQHFVWFDSPFLFSRSRSVAATSSGTDFLLPYWMGRYLGFLPDE